MRLPFMRRSLIDDILAATNFTEIDIETKKLLTIDEDDDPPTGPQAGASGGGAGDGGSINSSLPTHHGNREKDDATLGMVLILLEIC